MANRKHVWFFILNEEGEPIEDATVYLYQAQSTTPVWYYENRNTGLPYKSYDVGSGSDSNLKLITTDSQGYFDFYISYDDNDDQSYDPSTQFKIYWIKAGVANGTLDDLDLIPNAIPVDETDTDTTKNKLVSNALAARWEATANLTAPEISANADALFDVWNHITSAGELDDTPIGLNTPSSGSFTLLTCTVDPTSGGHVGNRDYNDSRYTTATAVSAHLSDTSTHGVTEILGSSESQSVSNKEIDSSIIGQTTPSAGKFTTLECDDPTTDAHVGDRGYNDSRYTLDSTYSAHASGTTGMHGVGGGNIMGTTLTQNVSNKAVTNSTIGYSADGTLTNPSSGGFSYLLAQAGQLNNVTIGNSVKGSGSFSIVDIDAGNIDGVVLGNSTPVSGTFDYVDINDGTIDGTTIGLTVPTSAVFTYIDADSGYIDDTVIGASNPTSGSFTHLTSTTSNLNQATIGTCNVTTLSAGTYNLTQINGTPIGQLTPDVGYFTFMNVEESDIDGGYIDDTVIGRHIPASGSFTDLFADSITVENIYNYNISDSAVTLSGGTMDAVVIGDSVPTSAHFTDIFSNTSSAGTVYGNQGVFNEIQVSEIDNVTIGGTTPGEGNFSVLNASGGTLQGVNISTSSEISASIVTSSLSATGASLVNATGNSSNWVQTGGSIDGTPIGLTTPANANFLNVNANYADIDSGLIDNCTIGSSTPASAAFTKIEVSGDAKLVGSYSKDLNGDTYRDALIRDDGTVGYDSSALRGKTNVQDIEDTSWLLNFRPVNYEPKVKDESGNYFEISTGIKEYGLIAEEVEKVNNHFVFYDPNGEIAGVHYKKLITPMLNEIIKLRKELDELKKPKKKRTYKKKKKTSEETSKEK